MTSPKPWTPAEDAELTRLYACHRVGEIARAMNRTPGAIKNRVHKIGIKKPAGHSNAGRFNKGDQPWNKGIPYDGGPNSRATRFKPGHRPANWYPVGHERISADGYRERKISDTGITRHDYVPLHLLLWREHHGDIPARHAVVFKNKDRADIRIDNLECISRRELMARNTVHNYPPELRQVIRLKGAISKRIGTRERKEQQP